MDRIAIGINLKSVSSVSDIVNYINNNITKYGSCTLQQLINRFEDDINITANIDLVSYGWNKRIYINKDVTICKFNLYSDRYESFMFDNVTRLHVFSSGTQESSDTKTTQIFYNIGKYCDHIKILHFINTCIKERGYCRAVDIMDQFNNSVVRIDTLVANNMDINIGWNNRIDINDIKHGTTTPESSDNALFYLSVPQAIKLVLPPQREPVDIKEKGNQNMTTIYYNITKLGGYKDILEYINKHIQKNGYCTVRQLINHFSSQALLVLPIYDELTYGWTKQIGINTEQQFNPADSTIPGYLFSISIPQAEELVLPPQEPVDVNVEMVNHPNHYNHEGRKECWDEMIDLFGVYYTGIFDLLTAYKYFYRAGTKEDNSRDQDIAKMNNYLNHCNELIIHGASNISSNESDMQTQQVALLATRYIALKHKIEREMTANPAE